MWQFYNPNPKGRLTGDCSVRALSAALNMGWDEAYMLMCAKGYELCDMPSANSVWGEVLKNHGFTRQAIPSTCPDCYTAEDFCRDNKTGLFVLGFGTHVATVRDGILFDSWNSSGQVPQYLWRR